MVNCINRMEGSSIDTTKLRYIIHAIRSTIEVDILIIVSGWILLICLGFVWFMVKGTDDE